MFYAKDGYLRPQLIVSAHTLSGLICPECRNEEFVSRVVLATPVPLGTFFEEGSSVPTATTTPDVSARLTLKQHLRSLVRWLAPYDEEGQELLFMFGLIFLVVTFAGIILGKWGMVGDTASIYWWLAKLYLIVHFGVALMWLGASLAIKGRTAPVLWKADWRRAGEEPLFQNLRAIWRRGHDRRVSRAWLRNTGMARKAARRAVRRY